MTHVQLTPYTSCDTIHRPKCHLAKHASAAGGLFGSNEHLLTLMLSTLFEPINKIPAERQPQVSRTSQNVRCKQRCLKATVSRTQVQEQVRATRETVIAYCKTQRSRCSRNRLELPSGHVIHIAVDSCARCHQRAGLDDLDVIPHALLQIWEGKEVQLCDGAERVQEGEASANKQGVWGSAA